MLSKQEKKQHRIYVSHLQMHLTQIENHISETVVARLYHHTFLRDFHLQWGNKDYVSVPKRTWTEFLLWEITE